jgi:hypothetical protein
LDEPIGRNIRLFHLPPKTLTMKKSITFLILALSLLFTLRIAAQPSRPELQQAQVDVVYLASDLLEGREAGTKGERMAADYIASRFAQIGLKPAGHKGGWFYSFDFKYNPNPHGGPGGEARTGVNVAGYIDNKAKTTVIIGAHYDHLGYGHFGSRHTGEPAIHNGADDNASGTAGLLRLAHHLKNSKKARKNNYLFLAFSAEELGLIGSKMFASDSLFFDKKKANYMLNMDMIGRLNEEKVMVVSGTGTSPVWKETLAAIPNGGITLKTSDSGVGASDHTSFYLQDIPALHFFTGQHSDYHKPEDDAELINYEGILDVTDLMIALIEHLDGKGKLAFTKTKDEEEGRRAASFKVSLGVMPDYVYDGEGMRVDGVTEGRPGEKAGMQKGDIIIGIGELEIKTIYDYMDGLSKFEKGQKTTLKVKRGEQLLELPVEF